MPTSNENPIDTPDTIIHEIRHYFHFLAAMGCRGFDCSVESIETMQRWGNGIGLDDETISGLEATAKACLRCRLSGSRRKIVFGSGDPQARLMFIGDYPDQEDEAQGLPFVGQAGDLLTKIIQAMGFARESVYVCNAVKCRLPDGQDPLQEEIAACHHWIRRQIQIIQPVIICTLGAIATKAVLKTAAPLSDLRGRFHQYDRMMVMPTYHPALLLKDAARKRDVWEDMKLVMNAYQQRVQQID